MAVFCKIFTVFLVMCLVERGFAHFHHGSNEDDDLSIESIVGAHQSSKGGFIKKIGLKGGKTKDGTKYISKKLFIAGARDNENTPTDQGGDAHPSLPENPNEPKQMMQTPEDTTQIGGAHLWQGPANTHLITDPREMRYGWVYQVDHAEPAVGAAYQLQGVPQQHLYRSMDETINALEHNAIDVNQMNLDEISNVRNVESQNPPHPDSPPKPDAIMTSEVRQMQNPAPTMTMNSMLIDQPTQFRMDMPQQFELAPPEEPTKPSQTGIMEMREDISKGTSENADVKPPLSPTSSNQEQKTKMPEVREAATEFHAMDTAALARSQVFQGCRPDSAYRQMPQLEQMPQQLIFQQQMPTLEHYHGRVMEQQSPGIQQQQPAPQQQQLPSIEQHQSEQQMPGQHLRPDSEPQQQQSPASFDQRQMPSFQQQMPTFQQQMPSFQQQMPSFEQRQSDQQQSPPQLPQPDSEQHQQLAFDQRQSGIQQQMPGFQQQMPSFQQQMPAFEQQQPAFEHRQMPMSMPNQQMPGFQQQQPIFEHRQMQQQMPSFQQQMQQQMPSFQQQMPTFEQRSSDLEQQMPQQQQKPQLGAPGIALQPNLEGHAEGADKTEKPKPDQEKLDEMRAALEEAPESRHWKKHHKHHSQPNIYISVPSYGHQHYGVYGGYAGGYGGHSHGYGQGYGQGYGLGYGSGYGHGHGHGSYGYGGYVGAENPTADPSVPAQQTTDTNSPPEAGPPAETEMNERTSSDASRNPAIDVDLIAEASEDDQTEVVAPRACTCKHKDHDDDDHGWVAAVPVEVHPDGRLDSFTRRKKSLSRQSLFTPDPSYVREINEGVKQMDGSLDPMNSSDVLRIGPRQSRYTPRNPYVEFNSNQYLPIREISLDGKEHSGKPVDPNLYSSIVQQTEQSIKDALARVGGAQGGQVQVINEGDQQGSSYVQEPSYQPQTYPMEQNFVRHQTPQVYSVPEAPVRLSLKQSLPSFPGQSQYQSFPSHPVQRIERTQPYSYEHWERSSSQPKQPLQTILQSIESRILSCCESCKKKVLDEICDKLDAQPKDTTEHRHCSKSRRTSLEEDDEDEEADIRSNYKKLIVRVKNKKLGHLIQQLIELDRSGEQSSKEAKEDKAGKDGKESKTKIQSDRSVEEPTRGSQKSKKLSEDEEDCERHNCKGKKKNKVSRRKKNDSTKK